jgi:hypothetical protein
MRRISVILMIFSAILIIGTGIEEASPRHTGLANHHVAAASLFLIAACIHGWYNWKAMVKYFGGLCWRWAIIAGCLIGVLAVGNLLV